MRLEQEPGLYQPVSQLSDPGRQHATQQRREFYPSQKDSAEDKEREERDISDNTFLTSTESKVGGEGAGLTKEEIQREKGSWGQVSSQASQITQRT